MHYRRGWIAFLLFNMTLINYIDRTTLSFAIDPISQELGLSTVAKGYLFSSFLWTYTVCLIPIGWLVDRYGAKVVAGLGVGIWSIATVFTGLAPTFGAMLACRLVMGAGEASTNPAGAKVIREWIPSGERGALTAFFNSGAYAGPAICALTAAPIIENFGWPSLFYIMGGLGLVWSTVWWAFYKRPEDASWLTTGERKWILEKRAVPSKPANAESSGLKALLRGPTLWGLALSMGCNVYSQYLFLTWLPSYLRTTKGLNLSGSGLFTALPYAVAMVLCILIGLASDKLLRHKDVSQGGRRNLIAFTMVLGSVILIAPLIQSFTLLVCLLALSMTGVAATASQTQALTNDLLTDPRDIGVAIGVVVVGGNIFGMLAPIVTGYVIAATGNFTWAFVIAGCLLVLGAGSILTLTHQPIGSRWRGSPRVARAGA